MGNPTLTQLEKSLQTLVDSNVKGGVPGVILQVTSSAIGLDWQGAAGYFARNEPRLLRSADSFRLASITKTFTATTILLLAEQTRLALDEPISQYLPSEIVGGIHVLNGISSGAKLTIRELLNHTSGIYDYVQDEKFLATIRVEHERNWSPLELVQASIELGQPYAPAGTGLFYYSDTNYVLAGLIIEVVTGLVLHRAYRKFVLEPLGMQETYFEGYEGPWGGGERGRPEISHNYYGELDLNKFNLSYDWSGGGLVSNAQDLTRFLHTLIEGDFLKPSSWAEMKKWVPEARPGTGGRQRFARYGLGIGIIKINGEELIGHSGAWGAFMYYITRLGATLTGTFNLAGVDRGPVFSEVINVLRA